MSLMSKIIYFHLATNEEIGFFEDDEGQVQISVALLDYIMEKASFGRLELG